MAQMDIFLTAKFNDLTFILLIHMVEKVRIKCHTLSYKFLMMLHVHMHVKHTHLHAHTHIQYLFHFILPCV